MATAFQIEPEQPTNGPFAWAGNLCTRHSPPRHAELLDGEGPRGQRRVAILGDYATSLHPTDPRSKTVTTWLYSEDGTLEAAGPEWRLREAS